MLFVSSFFTQGLQARAVVEHGPLGEFFDFRFEGACMSLVLAH